MPVPTPTSHAVPHDLGEALSQGLMMGFWEFLKHGYPLILLVIAVNIVAAMMRKKRLAERDAFRQAKVYENARLREQARLDARAEHQRYNR